MVGSHYSSGRPRDSTHDFSEGAEILTRGRVCYPVVLDQESQPVAFLIVGTQGTEQARAHRVHLGLLHPVIQLQIREAAAGGLDESWNAPAPDTEKPSVRRLFNFSISAF